MDNKIILDDDVASKFINLSEERAKRQAAEPHAAEWGLELGSDLEIANRAKSAIEAKSGALVFDEGEFWTFNATHWSKFANHDIEVAIHKFDGAEVMTEGRGRPERIRLSAKKVHSIKELLQRRCFVDGFFAAQPAGINCASGFIRFAEDGEPTLEPHSPELRCRHVLAGRWAPGNNPVPQPGTLLHTLLAGSFKGDGDAEDKAGLLSEVAGVAAAGKGSTGTRPQAVVMYGQSAENGKSQIIEMISGLLPEGSVSHVSPGQMGAPEYAIKMSGTLLNVANELSSARAVASEIFKASVTGEPFECRKLHHNPVTVRVAAQHIFATNVLPSFQGGFDKGVRRRLLVLEFNRTIPKEERVKDIGKRIAAEEMDLLLAWAVDGAARRIARGRFEELASCQQALTDWVVGADAVLGWLDEQVITGSGGEITVKAAYADFKMWCESLGIKNFPASNAFSQRVQSAGKGIEGKSNGKARALKGVRFA